MSNVGSCSKTSLTLAAGKQCVIADLALMFSDSRIYHNQRDLGGGGVLGGVGRLRSQGLGETPTRCSPTAGHFMAGLAAPIAIGTEDDASWGGKDVSRWACDWSQHGGRTEGQSEARCHSSLVWWEHLIRDYVNSLDWRIVRIILLFLKHLVLVSQQ